MLLTHFDPEVGLPPRWLTPGGGIDQGESAVEAAVRELYEETGLKVSADQLGEVVWHTSGRWDWTDGNFHTYEDTFYHLVVDGLDLNDSGWTQEEFRDVVEFRWWNPRELLATRDSVAPHGLAEFLVDHFS